MIGWRLRGFSLIEMMVTIAILGLLVALAVPTYQQWITNTHIRNAADSIQNGLRLARNEAAQRALPVSFELTNSPTGSSNWMVCAAPTTDCAALPAGSSSLIQQFNASGGASGIVLTASNSATSIIAGAAKSAIGTAAALPASVTFNTLGRPNTGSLYRIDVASTQTGTRRLVTTISIGGTIHMCDSATTFSATSPQGCL